MLFQCYQISDALGRAKFSCALACGSYRSFICKRSIKFRSSQCYQISDDLVGCTSSRSTEDETRSPSIVLSESQQIWKW